MEQARISQIKCIEIELKKDLWQLLLFQKINRDNLCKKNY
jgi:hypothetical protein